MGFTGEKVRRLKVLCAISAQHEIRMSQSLTVEVTESSTALLADGLAGPPSLQCAAVSLELKAGMHCITTSYDRQGNASCQSKPGFCDCAASTVEDACNRIALQVGSGHQPACTSAGEHTGVRMLSWKAWHHALDQLWQTCLSAATRSRLILLGENVASIGTGQCHRRQETVLVCYDARTLDFAWRRLRLQGTVLEHISSRCLVSWTFPPLEIDRTITAKAHHAVMVAMPSADQLEETREQQSIQAIVAQHLSNALVVHEDYLYTKISHRLDVAVFG